MPELMSLAERASVAQPQLSKRSVDGVQRAFMRLERTWGVSTLESSKWWVSRRRGSDRGKGR